MLWLKPHNVSPGNITFILENHYCTHLFMSTKGAVSSVSRLLQDMQHGSKHRSIVWALRKHFSLIFIGPSQYLIAKTAVLELLFYQFELFPLFGGFAFRWLYVVSGCLVCKLEYVSSNDTLDLKSKDRPQYIPIWLWRYVSIHTNMVCICMSMDVPWPLYRGMLHSTQTVLCNGSKMKKARSESVPRAFFGPTKTNQPPGNW